MWSLRAFLRKRANAEREKAADRKQWMALTFTLPSGEIYGNQLERDKIHEFSHQLAAEISQSGLGTFDGDEFGERKCSLYAYGADADALFETMLPLLSTWDFMKGGYAIKRYGDPVASEKITFQVCTAISLPLVNARHHVLTGRG